MGDQRTNADSAQVDRHKVWKDAAEAYREIVTIPTGALLNPVVRPTFDQFSFQAWEFCRQLPYSQDRTTIGLAEATLRSATRIWVAGSSDLPPPDLREPCVQRASIAFLDGTKAIDTLAPVCDIDVKRALYFCYRTGARFFIAAVAADENDQKEIAGLISAATATCRESALWLGHEIEQQEAITTATKWKRTERQQAFVDQRPGYRRAPSGVVAKLLREPSLRLNAALWAGAGVVGQLAITAEQAAQVA